MSAGTSFVIYFLAYAILFVIVVALVVAASFIGIKWRKSKNIKAGLDEGFTQDGY